MKDLFGNEYEDKPAEIRIFADEIQSKKCPYTNEDWFYIGIVVEDLSNPLLEDIISQRFRGNLNESSPYYEKNNRVIHWSEITDIDTKNICKRWFEYILSPDSIQKFYVYILGINDSKLNKEEFSGKEQFNSKYNRFFRSAILYALKTFFPNKKIIVHNIYHEEGQQKYHKFFPWHSIYKIEKEEENITFNSNKIKFLPKDHRKDKKSNLIQLCDALMGACTSIIHGIRKSKTSKYREELMDIVLPLVERMINEPYNKSSRYQHSNRIMIRFFPKGKSAPDDIKRLQNQFYIKRSLYYEEQKSGQQSLF